MKKGMLLFIYVLLVTGFSCLVSYPSNASDKPDINDQNLKAVDPLSKPYADVMRMIISEAGLNPTYIAAPNRRSRNMFVSGDLDIECCVMPLWRDWPEE